MFDLKSSGKSVPPDGLSAKALNASNAAAKAAQSAAASAQLAAQSATEQYLRPAAHTATEQYLRPAAKGMRTSMRQGVNSARGWAAPRIETAADYTTETVAPKVADALRSTARQVSPPDSRKSGLRSALSKSILAVAAAAAAGAIAMIVRRQLKSVNDKPVPGSEDMDAEDSAEPGARVPGQAGSPSDQGAGVNGQTASSAW